MKIGLVLIFLVLIAPIAYALDGDVDGDGFVTPADLNKVNAAAVTTGSSVDTSVLPINADANLDVNNDGNIDSSDVNIVQDALNPQEAPVSDPIVSSGSGSSGGGGGGSDNHPAVVTSTQSTPTVVEPETQPTIQTSQETDNEITGAATAETGNGSIYVAIVLGGLAVLGIGFFLFKKYF